MASESGEPETLAGWIATFGAISILTSAAIVGAHVIHWLRLATWPSYSTAELLASFGIGAPNFRWAGVQSIAEWLVGVSAAANLFWLGILMLFASAQMWETRGK